MSTVAEFSKFKSIYLYPAIGSVERIDVHMEVACTGSNYVYLWNSFLLLGSEIIAKRQGTPANGCGEYTISFTSFEREVASFEMGTVRMT
jgi:hypothetical protein